MNEQLLEPQSDNRMEKTAEKRRLKLRNPLKGLRGKKKRWLLLLVVIALAGGAVTVRLLSKPQTASAVTSYQEEEISQRDIVNSLSSSGTLQPADSYTVSTLVSGEILSDTFEEGDLVEEGQLKSFYHKGFWQCMDTQREMKKLEELWQSGKAPWKIWKD